MVRQIPATRLPLHYWGRDGWGDGARTKEKARISRMHHTPRNAKWGALGSSDAPARTSILQSVPPPRTAAASSSAQISNEIERNPKEDSPPNAHNSSSLRQRRSVVFIVRQAHEGSLRSMQGVLRVQPRAFLWSAPRGARANEKCQNQKKVVKKKI